MDKLELLEFGLMCSAIIATIFLLGLGVVANVRRDRLLSKMYHLRPDLWTQFGKPTGWMWTPPGQLAVPWRMTWPRLPELLKTPARISNAPEIYKYFQDWRRVGRYALFYVLPIAITLWALFGVLKCRQ
jgi:hypothetical protein